LDSAETAEGVRNDSTFVPVAKLWERLDVVLVGASGLSSRTSMGASGVFAPEEIRQMEAAGAVCAMNFLFLDAEGRVLDHPVARRIINLPVEQLKRVSHVVVVASGPAKIEPIRVALKSGLVTTLISDVETARGLMAE
jgi:DNA-binding transcriptional regulator LsrR (DeoR family)